MPAPGTLQRFFRTFSTLARRSTPGIWQAFQAEPNHITIASQITRTSQIDFTYNEGARGLLLKVTPAEYTSTNEQTNIEWAAYDANFIAWCGGHKQTIRRALYLYALLGQPTQEQDRYLRGLFPGLSNFVFSQLISYVEREADSHGRTPIPVAQAAGEGESTPSEILGYTEHEEERVNDSHPRGTAHESTFEQDGEPIHVDEEEPTATETPAGPQS